MDKKWFELSMSYLLVSRVRSAMNIGGGGVTPFMNKKW